MTRYREYGFDREPAGEPHEYQSYEGHPEGRSTLGRKLMAVALLIGYGGVIAAVIVACILAAVWLGRVTA